MTAYPVAEKFVSINGEGLHAGELAAFIRFKECNLCCKYCDTKWANSADAPAELLTVSELVDFADSSGALNVTLTGGEPLLQTQLPELVTALVRNGFRTEIETNGSLPIGELSNLPERPVFTVDYKLPGSGMENRMLTDNFRFLTKGDSVKFVAGSDRDLIRAREVISEYDLTSRCSVLISPVFGSIDPAEIVEFMKNHSLSKVRLQLQLHKIIWSPDKRGV